MTLEESIKRLSDVHLDICKNEALNPNNFSINFDEYEQMKNIFGNIKYEENE